MFNDIIVDNSFRSIKDDTPVAIFEYLKNNKPFPSDWSVYVGKPAKVVTIEDYIENFEKLH